MQRRTVPASVLACLVVLSAVLLGLSGSVVADDEYKITVPGSVDTPTREVDVQGTTYEISAIAKADVNDTVDIEITPPESDSEFRPYLYDSDGVVPGVGGTLFQGGATATFDLTGIEAGTYAVGISDGPGVPEKIHPLVIKGFDTTTSTPDSVTVGNDVSVDVTVTRLEDDATNDRVEVILANDTYNTSTTATKDGGQYTATVGTDGLATGSYDVYANVRGTETVFGEKVLFGVSDVRTVKIESADDSGATTESGGGGGGAIAPPAATATETGTDTATTAGLNQSSATTTPQGTTAQPASTAAAGSDTDTVDDGSTPDSDPDSDDGTAPAESESAPATPSETASEVVTPSGSQATTDTSLPGFGAPLVGVVLLVLMIASRTVRRQ